MMRLVLAVALAATSPALADPYCLPHDDKDRIVKTASTCPVGYVSTGRCCEALHADTKKAAPRIKGTACPSGTFASAGACVSLR